MTVTCRLDSSERVEMFDGKGLKLIKSWFLRAEKVIAELYLQYQSLGWCGSLKKNKKKTKFVEWVITNIQDVRGLKVYWVDFFRFQMSIIFLMLVRRPCFWILMAVECYIYVYKVNLRRLVQNWFFDRGLTVTFFFHHLIKPRPFLTRPWGFKGRPAPNLREWL